MKASALIKVLETLAPPPIQESYDNCGLLVGSADTDITAILVSLDCTEAVIDEALAHGCNMVVSHHPIIFGGLKRLNGSGHVERTVIKAIKNEVLLYAMHTNLDNVAHGVNALIAQKLNLTKTRILSPKKGLLRKLVTYVPATHLEKVQNALWQAGAGHIGHYDQCSFSVSGTGTFRGNDQTNPYIGQPGVLEHADEVRTEVIFPEHLQDPMLGALHEAHPYEEVAFEIYRTENPWQEVGSGVVGQLAAPMPMAEFLGQVKETMHCACMRHTRPHTKNVSTVAVCGGSGSFLLNDALRAGADVLITSDFKYHQFFDADNRITIADIGHYESEQFTPQLIVDHLKHHFPTFATRFSEVNTNPINYL